MRSEKKDRDYKLERRKDARGIWYITWRENGKPKRASTGKTHEEDALQLLHDFVNGLDTATVAETTKYTVMDCVVAHANMVQKRGNINRDIEMNAKLVRDNSFGQIFPEDLTHADVRSLIGFYKRKGYADSTISYRIALIHAAMVYAHDKMVDLCPFLPRFNIKNVQEEVVQKRKRTRWLDVKEVSLLLETASGFRTTSTRSKLVDGVWIKPEMAPFSSHLCVENEPYPRFEPWVSLFVNLMLATSARISAVCELTWDRVTDELITLENPKLRGRRKGRATIPTPDSIKPILQEAREKSRNGIYVLETTDGTRVSPLLARLRFAAAAQQAGLNVNNPDNLKRVVPHTIRHTMATHLLHKKVDIYVVSKQLGHSDIKTTQDNYLHHSPKFQKEAVLATDLMLKRVNKK